MNSSGSTQHPASFRDPSGFVFWEKDILYRSVSTSYKEYYEQFMSSGLYQALVDENLLVAHTEVSTPKLGGSYKTLKPEMVPFISYPYEWCFSQLKAAALATLQIQLLALEHQQSLKDASAYNIQFLNGKPIFIDTLSFEPYTEGKPWIAYRQFCQHFLAPLALMAHRDLRLGTLSQMYLDGIPLDLAAQLLPSRARFHLGLATHIHLHARSQSRHADDGATQAQAISRGTLNKNSLLGILRNLESTVQGMRLPQQKTEWGDYYTDTNYTQAGHTHKREVITKWIEETAPHSAWDVGANDASYSRIISTKGIFTVASDIDPLAVERGFVRARSEKDSHVLPLVVDITNPSPSIGWQNTERASFLERAHFELTMALAVVHHLAISNNLPLSHLASFFSEQTRYLIIEFIPKEDSNVQRLLATREDIFPAYTQKDFEQEFGHYFVIQKQVVLTNSTRTLYLMEKKK